MSDIISWIIFILFCIVTAGIFSYIFTPQIRSKIRIFLIIIGFAKLILWIFFKQNFLLHIGIGMIIGGIFLIPIKKQIKYISRFLEYIFDW
jgi:hypothetical protein